MSTELFFAIFFGIGFFMGFATGDYLRVKSFVRAHRERKP